MIGLGNTRNVTTLTLCMSSLMTTWRLTALSYSSRGKGEGNSMKGAKCRASRSNWSFLRMQIPEMRCDKIWSERIKVKKTTDHA